MNRKSGEEAEKKQKNEPQNRDNKGMNQEKMPTPYEGNDKFIFISYSHQDTDRVLPIIRRLMADGFRVWYDDGISPGTEWPEVIANHVNDCELFVSFLSNSYMDSFNCKRELDFSIRRRKKLLAVFLEETELPLGVEMQISTVQAVSYYKTSPELFFERLYESEVVRSSGCREEQITVSQERAARDAANPESPANGAANSERSASGAANSESSANGAANLESPANGAANSESSASGAENVNSSVSDAANQVSNGSDTVNPISSVNNAAPKKKKIWIPILIGVLVILGIAGIAVGVGGSKSNSGNTKKNPRTIELSDITVTDKVLRREAKGKDLRQIKLENCEISIRNKEVWSEILNEKVTQITITGCGLTDGDAKEILDHSPGLKTLVFSKNELKEISFVQNLKLQNADLSDNQITRIESSNFEELTVLNLDDNELSDLGFLESAIHLHTLKAERNKLESIDTLKNCAILTRVYLSENQIADVSALGAAKDRIEELNLSNNHIRDIGSIWPMPVLKKLCVDHNDLTTLYLTQSVKLSYLSARNNQIDSLTGDFEELAYLDVADNKLSGDYFFADCPKLKKGFFENNMISELHLPGGKYANGRFSMYNNPLAILDYGTEVTSYDFYISYEEDLKGTLNNKIGLHLYLLDCPYDERVHFEESWGAYSVSFPEKKEMEEAVEALRKGF